MNRETEAKRIHTEPALREFLKGCIEADGVNGLLYEIARVLDSMAQETLQNGHGSAAAHETATRYMEAANRLYHC